MSERYPSTCYRYARDYFDPDPGLVVLSRDAAIIGLDRPTQAPYEYDEEIILAVNAALAAGRPLLVAGPAGTGKSALAANIAAQLGWDYQAKVVTSATEGRDLLWRFDAVQRLHDAYVPGAAADLPVENYLSKGVLWHAFDASRQGRRTVVLIDEIDKADPDVPNSLLEVLGNGEITVDVIKGPAREVRVNDDSSPLIVITTNDERELSRPFRRRCVTLTLAAPSASRLVGIAERWGLTSGPDRAVAERVALEVAELKPPLSPNVAEYLDALRVCLKLDIAVGGQEWAAVKRATLTKQLDPAMPG